MSFDEKAFREQQERLQAEVIQLREALQSEREKNRSALLRQDRLRNALNRCLKAMKTVQVEGVPPEVAMRDPKFREFVLAARDAEDVLKA